MPSTRTRNHQLRHARCFAQGQCLSMSFLVQRSSASALTKANHVASDSLIEAPRREQAGRAEPVDDWRHEGILVGQQGLPRCSPHLLGRTSPRHALCLQASLQRAERLARRCAVVTDHKHLLASIQQRADRVTDGRDLRMGLNAAGAERLPRLVECQNTAWSASTAARFAARSISVLTCCQPTWKRGSLRRSPLRSCMSWRSSLQQERHDQAETA
jgi:hypothetical protein